MKIVHPADAKDSQKPTEESTEAPSESGVLESLQAVPDDRSEQDQPEEPEVADSNVEPEDKPADKPEVPDLVPVTADSNTEPEVTPVDEDDATPFDDDKTSAAISDIVAKEGDDVLAIQDAAATKHGVKTARKGHVFSRLLHSKFFRWFIVLVIVGGVGAVAVLPTARYWVLTTAGVRVGSSVLVVDDTTKLPLKGVVFALGGKQAQTNSDGKATLTGLQLGPQTVTIRQAGFADITRPVTLGWGSNPLGTIALRATGIQYTIQVTDYLSDKPLEGVEATNDEVTAISDKAGKITFTVPNLAVAEQPVTVSKSGYRSEQVSLGADSKKTVTTALVVARKTVYATKASGKYDIFTSDLDGKNAQLLLPGTGSETSNVSLVMSPDGNRAALVSTRDNKHDASGFLLSSLTLIDISTGNTLTVAQAPQIQLVDWIGPRIVFEQVATDASASNRYVVTSYDYTNNTRLQLTAANKLNAVLSAQGMIYYAPAADANKPTAEVGVFKISPDGSGKQSIFADEADTVLRTAYNTFNIQTTDSTWYTYDLPTNAKSQISTPASTTTRQYIDNANRTVSAWVNQGALVRYDVSAGKETTLHTQSGLTYPLRWLGADVLLYRMSSAAETADYVISPSGGTAHKVADVAATYGF